MKKQLFSLIGVALSTLSFSQTYSPIAATGYTLDGIAESSPALSSTTGMLDGSDYVLYSASYNPGYGLPNSGTITSGSRTYQINPYAGNNTLFIMASLKDSLTFTTPAPYAGISLLGFATEGPGTMNITLRFTDGSSQLFTGKTVSDWFSGSSGSVISGIDRVGRSTNSPGYSTTNPSMYPVDLAVSCANRSKNVQRVIVENTHTNSRLCLFAVSGAALPSYSVNATNATCFGNTNGTAAVVSTGGILPFTYTWTTTPVQTAATATGLPAGNYTVTISDGPGCIQTSTTAITQPTTVLTTTIHASQTTVCSGSTTTLTTSGANTYTWSTSAHTATAVVIPTTTGIFSLTGTTAAGCSITASISINVNPLPILSIAMAASYCSNVNSVPLSATPAGGTFAGSGVSGTSLSPSAIGPGTYTISYTYTDANNCTATSAVTTNVIVCTGLNELEKVTYNLYPNPNNGSFTIKANAQMNLTMMNELGQTVKNIVLSSVNNYEVSIDNLPIGIYVLLGQNNQSVMTQKIIVTK